MTECSPTPVVSGHSSCNSGFQLLSAGQSTNAAADSKELSHLCATSAYQPLIRLKEEKEPAQSRKTKPKVVWDKETGEIRIDTERDKEVEGT